MTSRTARCGSVWSSTFRCTTSSAARELTPKTRKSGASSAYVAPRPLLRRVHGGSQFSARIEPRLRFDRCADRRRRQDAQDQVLGLSLHSPAPLLPVLTSPVLPRNPWGEKEWDGDWSDKSPLWTPQIKVPILDPSAVARPFHSRTLPCTWPIPETARHRGCGRRRLLDVL